MAIEIRVPTLGESITEATVGEWYKKAGDTVEIDEPIVELETDKVTIEVPAPVSGILTHIVIPRGEDVQVGAIIGTIAKETLPAPTAPTRRNKKQPDLPPRAMRSAITRNPLPDTDENNSSPAPARHKRKAKPTRVLPHIIKTVPSPKTLKKTRQQTAAPLSVTDDLLKIKAPAPGDESAREERVPMTRLRRTIARRLQEVQSSTAMLTTFNEVDMSSIMTLRKTYRDVFLEKHTIKLGIMSFFVKAVIQALKEFPTVNAEIDNEDIVYKNYYHIGVAVGTEKGLVVPVLRDADQMRFADIEKNIVRLAQKAKNSTLKISDLQGGTFSLTNGGIYGSMMSTPILNAPQAAILGMHKIQDRPVAIGGQVVIRPMMYLALTYDHRLIDGKDAVSFLIRIKGRLEDPERLLLDL